MKTTDNMEIKHRAKQVSDGNMVVRVRDNQVVIAWHNTPHNTNNMTVMERNDARGLYALLGSILGGTVSATEE